MLPPLDQVARRALAVILFSTPTGLLAACGGGGQLATTPDEGGTDGTVQCSAGETRPCPCPDGAITGTQTCGSMGRGYGTCTGCSNPVDGSEPTDVADAGSDSLAASDSADANGDVLPQDAIADQNADAQSEASLSCDASGDCLSRQSCDPLTHTCSSQCSATQLCKAGCCQGATCVAGTDVSACGVAGSCTDCTTIPDCTDPTTHAFDCVCSYGNCAPPPTPVACSAPTDCPVGQACNRTTGTCTFQCGAANESNCNAGCCAGNVCVPGVDDQACGQSGGACVDCVDSCSPGPACLSLQGCGCATNAQCGGANACGARTACEHSSFTCLDP